MSAEAGTYEGSCLCGKVRYRFAGPPGKMTHCHCTDCRKHTGSAFETSIEVQRPRFSLLSGEAELITHRAESGTKRSFCRVCGSSLFSFGAEDPGFIYISAGTLDTRLEKKPDYHIFVRSRVPWLDIEDGLPQHAAYPEKQG